MASSSTPLSALESLDHEGTCFGGRDCKTNSIPLPGKARGAGTFVGSNGPNNRIVRQTPMLVKLSLGLSEDDTHADGTTAEYDRTTENVRAFIGKEAGGK